MTECPRHGLQPGPMVCAHLEDAVAQGERRPEEVAITIVYDGFPVGEARICVACEQEHRLTGVERVAIEVMEAEQGFPSLAPMCGLCWIG